MRGTSYREIEGTIRLTGDDIMRQFPNEFATAQFDTVRAELLQKGIYVPSNHERTMMFALGFATILTLGLFVWKK